MRFEALPGGANNGETLRRDWCEAGVVTRRAMEATEHATWCGRATRPKCADASCVGGNIAMNAGGKEGRAAGAPRSIIWRSGAWSRPMVSGSKLRMDHNVGKIRDANHATFHPQYLDEKRRPLREETLIIPGPSFRKIGLGRM